LTVREPASGPVRNIKRQKGKKIAGTKRGASSVKQGVSSVKQGTQQSSTLAERQKLCNVGTGIIMTIAAVARETLSISAGRGGSSGNFSAVEGLLRHVNQGAINPPSSSPNELTLPWQTVGTMAYACHGSELQESHSQLTYWLNTMQFASQVV
jgi:hypothetical protein